VGIKSFLKKWGWLYIPGFLFLALNSLLSTRIPNVLGDAIDILSSTEPSKAALLQKAGLIALIAVSAFAARFLWRLFIIGNARRMEVHLRDRLYQKLQQLPISFYRGRSSGDLMAYAINDIGAVRMTFGPIFAMAFNSITVAVLSIIGMIGAVDVRMTLLALVPVPLALISTSLLGMLVRKRSLRVQKLFAGLSGFVNESISGIKVIKSFARENEREAKFDEISTEMKNANVSLVDASSMINPLVTVAFGLSYAIALIVGGNAVIDGGIGAGTLVTFLGFLTLVQQPVTMLGNLVNHIQRGLASYKRLSEVFGAEAISEKEREYKERINESFKPAVKADSLTFRYSDAGENEKNAVDGISFDINAGGTLGIAGPTGCGKSTLLSIIAKLQPTERGALYVSNEDICDFPSAQLRSYLGYVPQDGFLFSATIAENIALGCDIDMERVRECARIACICDEIEAFPDGFETEVGERGTHLSGGQKQRVSLARALYRNPRLLLLDDTLSAVDNITERRLIENLGLDKKRGDTDTTMIIVSHRLSALENCDEILYIENGTVTERGTHKKLMELGGAYAETYKKQAEERDTDE